MNSWKLFGTAATAVLALACSATYGQSCGSPLPATVGDTAVATTSGVTVNLAGFCDPGPFGDDSIYNTTWYSWTADSTGSYVLQTCGSVDYDSRLAVLTNCSDMSTVLACNDDGDINGTSCLNTVGNPYASKLCFNAVEGTTYYFAVGGYSAGDVGSGSMNLSPGDCSGGGGGDPNCGTGSNDCCSASADSTPYCTDSDCCNTVCGLDSYCCTTMWDSICAGEAATYCTVCGGGSGCGGSTQDCCVANAGPYCSDADCCNTVCGFDPYCCDTAWDSICANEALSNCPNCAGGGTCSASTQDCCVANAGPFCSDSECCASVCGIDPYCCQTAWDGICANEAAGMCTVCGGGGTCGKSAQDCCIANPAPACSDADCCNTVCGVDPYCCQTAWDGICAGEAFSMCPFCSEGICGGSSSNDCCVAGGSPGCSDAECCAAVCAMDSFCCTTQWDAICADEASFTCASCFVPCDGPECNITEAEPCGSDMNGGCNGGPADPIALGDVVCGTFYSTTALRDTDWYALHLDEGTTVTASLYTAAPGLVAITDTNCAALTIFASATDGCPMTASICLPAGDYFVVALMSVFADIPCTSPSANYVLAVTGEPCDASPPANDECEGSIVVAAGGESIDYDTTFATSSLGGVVDPACEKGFGLTLVKDVWFSWTPDQSGPATVYTCNQAAYDTRLAAYTDCFGTIYACNDDGPGCANLTSRMDMDVTAGTTYYVRVGGYSGGGQGTVTFAYVVPLANDECEDRLPIYDGSTPFDTTTATDSMGGVVDPACEEGFGLSFVKDIWFTYEATCDGTVTVSTCNDASYDTRLAAYSDCFGTLVACNDDGPGCGLTSQMTFEATSGTLYLIRVGGFGGGGTGNITINCGGGGGGPSNDECDSPNPAADGANAFSTVGATSSNPPSSPAFCGAFATGFYNDVWFTYTPAFSGSATFTTCNAATFDTRLELWVGCPDAGGVLVACNDDGSGCANFTSTMTATLDCNTKYLVRVGAYSTTGFGTGTLTITPGSTPCEEPCPGDFNNDGIVDGADLGFLLGGWGAAGGHGPADFNDDGVIDGADLGTELGYWGPCD